MEKHLVFYDGLCGLCDHVVRFLLKHDKKGIFAFAPLQGKTAEMIPQKYRVIDTMVLVENFQSPQKEILIQSKAAWRICWLLGGRWAILGILSFLPGWIFNWGYRLVAQNRHRLFERTCILPDSQYSNRFYP